MKDYIENDLNFGKLYGCSSFNNPRLLQESEINMFGKLLIQLCKIHCIHILYRRISPDITESYKCLTHNAGRDLVDYSLVCSDLHSFIDKFEVINFDESDHLPIPCSASIE